MRVLLLSGDRRTARAYAEAAEETGLLRLVALKNTAQVLERLFRDPFDALISEDPSVLRPSVQNRPVLWPNHLFLLFSDSVAAHPFPESLTFCFPKDSDPKDVLRRIAAFPGGHRKRSDSEAGISHFLQQCGVPVSLSGFEYLREAIRLILERKRVIDVSSVNDLYEIVSSELGTTAYVAEHAMRHAIDTAWIRSDPTVLERLFGDTVYSDRSAPSNAAFLFRAADHIKISERGAII